jgi:hypothetical protein
LYFLGCHDRCFVGTGSSFASEASWTACIWCCYRCPSTRITTIQSLPVYLSFGHDLLSEYVKRYWAEHGRGRVLYCYIGRFPRIFDVLLLPEPILRFHLIATATGNVTNILLFINVYPHCTSAAEACAFALQRFQI